MSEKLYQHIAKGVITAKTTNILDIKEKVQSDIEAIVREKMPSGAGFDNGTYLNWEESSCDWLVFETSFHHMENGFYAGWTEHTVSIRPSLVSAGIEIMISGRNRNGIKEHITELFGSILKDEVV